MKKELQQNRLPALEEAVRKAGFPDKVLPEIRREIREARGVSCQACFSLRLDKDRVTGHLSFERDDEEEPFRLAYFYLDLGPRLHTHFHDAHFHFGQGFDLTLREGYNLICGRSIFRRLSDDLAGNGCWISLDRTVPDDDDLRFLIHPYGFSFSSAFYRCGLHAYRTPLQLEELERSLKEGNRQEPDLVVKGVPTRVWVEVSEGHQSVCVRDGEGERVCLPVEADHQE